MPVSGNLAFASGAIYLVQINPATASFANVTGTASLAGTVSASFATGSYVTKQYTILKSAGLGGTTFSGLANINLPAGFRDTLSYSTNDVFLNLTGTASPPARRSMSISRTSPTRSTISSTPAARCRRASRASSASPAPIWPTR